MWSNLSNKLKILSIFVKNQPRSEGKFEKREKRQGKANNWYYNMSYWPKMVYFWTLTLFTHKNSTDLREIWQKWKWSLSMYFYGQMHLFFYVYQTNIDFNISKKNIFFIGKYRKRTKISVFWPNFCQKRDFWILTWETTRDSNPVPLVQKSEALTTELPEHLYAEKLCSTLTYVESENSRQSRVVAGG
jgi:hypothetical protein